jgi:ribonuclease-3
LRTWPPSATPSTTSSPGWVRNQPISHSAADVTLTPAPDDGGQPAQGGSGAPLDELQARLGYTFTDPSLLLRALSHRSWCAENRGEPSNERLEFLGDSVLGLVVTDYLFRTNPGLPEGDLAKARAAVVSSQMLAEVAAEVSLGRALRLGRGEELSNGRAKTSILADAMEAVIGAVWLDSGWDAARGLILDLLSGRIAIAVAGPGVGDFKTRLQELSTQMVDEAPVYQIAESGPDHAKVFTATVLIGGSPWGSGVGRSKKQAEQAAAAEACGRMGTGGGPDAAQGEQRDDA